MMDEDQPSELSQCLHALSDELSGIVIREQQAMDDDLQRMGVMLRAAAVDLRACFNAMSEQLARQGLALRQRAAEPGADGQGMEQLLLTTDETSAAVARAVRALQFEDIVQQLIGHSRQRAAEMERMFAGIRAQLDGLHQPAAGDAAAILPTLKKCRADIRAVSAALQLDNPVKQASMDKGDVELF